MGASAGALVVVNPRPSQGAFKRPYETWTLEKYSKGSAYDRELFWKRASMSKRCEITQFLSALPERDELVQEARIGFGAEQFGLKAGGISSSSSSSSSSPSTFSAGAVRHVAVTDSQVEGEEGVI